MPHHRPLEGTIVTAFVRNIGSAGRLRRLLEFGNNIPICTWMAGQRRPQPLSALRMCRLLMWGAFRWPDEYRVHWEDLSVSGGMANPFQLSQNVTFGFGGQRDRHAVIRDALDRLGIEHKTHFGRLMGVPKRWQYRYVQEWRSGARKPGTHYLLRLLALLLWDWHGYPVSDMWKVHWESRTVEWSWDGHSTAPKPLPGNPFEWLAIEGKLGQRSQRKRVVAMPAYTPEYLAKIDCLVGAVAH